MKRRRKMEMEGGKTGKRGRKDKRGEYVPFFAILWVFDIGGICGG